MPGQVSGEMVIEIEMLWVIIPERFYSTAAATSTMCFIMCTSENFNCGGWGEGVGGRRGVTMYFIMCKSKNFNHGRWGEGLVGGRVTKV